MEDEGYTVLEVDVTKADDVIFDIEKEEFSYGYEEDGDFEDSLSSLCTPKSPKRMVKTKNLKRVSRSRLKK